MTQKLLFVDDSLTMHRVVAITFGQEDVTLVSAHSAAEALSQAAASRIDVALVDSHLGDMDGYSLCAKLQEAHTGAYALPVLMLVSDQHPVDEAKRLACGALGAVKKPFDTQTLVARVREAAAQTALPRASPTATSSPVAGAQAPQARPEKAAAAEPLRPAFFQAPPPVPLSADKTNPWTLSVGGPPASADGLPPEPAAAQTAHLPRMADLPMMPTWSLDMADADSQAVPSAGGPVPAAIAPDEPLWTEKESTTAEDLRRPEIDAGVVQLARADKDRTAEGDIAPAPPQAAPHRPLAGPGSAPAPAAAPTAALPAAGAASPQAVALTAQALGTAFAQLPPQMAQALGPDAALALAPALAQAIERAIWDVLPAIAQEETRAYLAGTHKR